MAPAAAPGSAGSPEERPGGRPEERPGAAAPVCRLCGAALTRTFVDLGSSPLANAYPGPEDLDRPEAFYPLHAYLCDECLLVQLPAAERPEAIFGDYAYFSSYSESWLAHCRRFAGAAIERFDLGPDTGSRCLVVEVASNDGYLLQYFRDAGVPVLGIEPAANVARVAEERGIPTRVRFFGRELGAELAAAGELADLLVGNNVLAHVPDLHDFLAGVATALAPGGVASFELPHLLRLLEGAQFDTIYHEHFSYFSLATARRAFAEHGLELYDVEELPTHGGSLRLFAHRRGERPRGAAVDGEPGSRVAELLDRERRAGLLDPATYAAFGDRVREVKRGLVRFLRDAAGRGETVAGYGAPAKGNTLLNYCGVGPDLVAFTVDRSPHKQGRYLPGTRIPIRAPEALREARPAWVLILPWNLKDEIVAQMAGVHDWGGRFVVAVPRLEEVG